MRPKTLLVLLVLVAGLGSFIWFFERDLPGSDERAQLEKRVLAVEAEEITELIIERAGAVARLSRPAATDDDADDVEDPSRVARSWRLLEPHDARADGGNADRLVEALATLEKVRTLDDFDPRAVGLDAPRATVTVRADGSESTLKVGAEIPASSNMVVQTGAGTFVVADSIWAMVSTEPGDWRSRELFPLHRGAVEKLELLAAGEPLTLAQRDETFWLEAPFEDLADSERLDQLLDSMFGVEVAAFLDQPELGDEEMGLAPPAATLTATFTGREQPVVLELGAAAAAGAEERYARIDGQTVRIGNDLDEAIAGEPADWQATSWTSLEVFEIDSFRAVDGDGELLLERAGADWSRAGVKIGYSPVSDFLYALTGVAAERVLPRDEARALGADLERPDLELTLKGSQAEESLALYDAEGLALAGRADRGYLLALSAGTVDDLRLKLQAVRDEEPLADEDEKQEG